MKVTKRSENPLHLFVKTKFTERTGGRLVCQAKLQKLQTLNRFNRVYSALQWQMSIIHLQQHESLFYECLPLPQREPFGVPCSPEEIRQELGTSEPFLHRRICPAEKLLFIGFWFLRHEG